MLNAGASSKALGHHLTRQSLNIGRKRATVPVRAYASWSERESSSPFSMEPRDWYPEPRKGPNGPNSRNDHSGRSGRSATTSQDRQRRRPPKTLPFGRFNRTGPPPHLLTLADLSLEEINSLLRSSLSMKKAISTFSQHHFPQHFANGTVALLFTKRSTRTRVASETAANMLGANAMFLGASDIQLGVNESLQDTAKVVGSMVEGFMARVDRHEDVEALAKDSPVPVINALSDLYHPTQILADVLTMFEAWGGPVRWPAEPDQFGSLINGIRDLRPLDCLQGKKAAWVGDTNNITNDLLVTLPRAGMELAIASPKGYGEVDKRVWDRVIEAGTVNKVTLTESPAEALKDADVVITDTWISMGQEEEKAARLQAFEGYQITESMVTGAGAKPDWKFMHCLPRKPEEVDDEVFYGPRSLVFPEAENRKWTTMACFASIFGRWKI